MRRLNMTRNLVKKNMRFYLGVSNEASFIIDYLVEKVEETYRGRFLTARDVVYIVLQKIRTDDSFKRLSHQYGVSIVRNFTTIFTVCALHCSTSSTANLLAI